MKRLLALLLALTFFLAFASCNEDKNDGKETETTTAIEETGEGVVLGQEHDADEVDEKIVTLKNNGGFFIRFEVTSDSSDQEEADKAEFAYGASGELYYFRMEEEEYYFDLTSETAVEIYTKEEDGWVKSAYTYGADYTKEQVRQVMDGYMAGISTYMTMYDLYSSYPMQKTSATVAGRACDQYTFSMNSFGVSLSFSFCVDRDTDICLKWDASGASLDGSGSASFECREFSTNYTVKLPANAKTAAN